MTLPIVIIVLLLDQLTKFLVTKYLLLNNPVPVIKGIFYLTLVHNRGAAFGILRNQVPLFIGTSVLAIILIFINLKSEKKEHVFSLINFALSLILAGGIGNLIDRVIFGHVIDFLDFRVWPVFNIADSAITAGAILLGWSLLTAKDKTAAGGHK